MRSILLSIGLCLSLLFFSVDQLLAQVPINDDCANATVINIPNGGFAIGTFNSDTVDMTNATVETGESFAAAIFVAAQDKKSVWFRFTLPTIRSVRVTLSQPAIAIAAGNVGFAVYKTNQCLPGIPDISNKLTPIATFGNSLHPCTDAGEYLVQVSSNYAANGPIFVQLELSDLTGALYDRPSQAYDFGVVGNYGHHVDFNTECHSLEDANEVCTAFTNQSDYQKSAWFTFTAPSYYDYISMLVSGTSGNNFNSPYKSFGYTLYKGDVRTTPYNQLPVVDGCDSLYAPGYYAGYKVYRCGELENDSVYTLQIIFHRDFREDLSVGIYTGGTGPTRAPEPTISGVPAPNAIGVLPATPNGTTTTVRDVLACNSRHTARTCSPSMDSVVNVSGTEYNLSSFITFSLASTSAVTFGLSNTQCGPAPIMRLYNQALTNNCTDLDTLNLLTVLYSGNRRIDCLPPGDYTLQVMGNDRESPPSSFHYYTSLYTYEICLLSNLGAGYQVSLTGYTLNPRNKFSLATAGAYDTLSNVGNVMTPIALGGSYQAQSDTFGCQNTLRPSENTCQPGNNKVIYRQFAVADSGILSFTGGFTYPLEYRIYEGSADSLATAQGVFSYPDTIEGLTPRTLCLDYSIYCNNKRVCMVPGTYTLTTFANDGEVGYTDRPSFTYSTASTLHNSPENAQDLGSVIDSIGPSGGTTYSDLDYWSCRDNADTINGYAPCNIGGYPATKAIYRQFYLKEPALVSISNIYAPYCTNYNFGYKTLFKGKATDGLDSLTPVGGQWNCFQNAAPTNGCTPLDSGWYSVVSYGVGPTYENPFQAVNVYGGYSSYVGYQDQFSISITLTCKGPAFNRPYKASIDTNTNQPYLVQWGNRVGSTAAYPFTDTTITLQQEYFNCTIDTPFTSHPIVACGQNLNRVAYYVFKTTQESYVQIDTRGYFGAVYNKDIRVDSLQFPNLTPVQPCLASSGHIQICKMQPGTYTLVIFAGDANSCSSVQPTIYVDRVGYSRFDFARNAYDFGVVPPDSAYHYGKTGDVNPLNSGRKPSNDFFYCTTGAFTSDPTESACDAVNPNVYNTRLNNRMWDSTFLPAYAAMPRRNLWYTFVVNQPGYVKVKVENKTINKGFQYRFAVYKSNVNGTLPFTTVVSTGQVDSTAAQGLSLVASNYGYYYCFSGPGEVSFYRDPCTNITERYYIVVDNPNTYPYDIPGMKPNSQAEVSVLVDSLTLVLPKFDHYYQANNLGSINSAVIARGAVDNYSCATRDATDPTYGYGSYANKTLWYKFTTSTSGIVRYRIVVNGAVKYSIPEVQLFRQIIPGDSTATGLKIQNTANETAYDPLTNSYWASTCVSPGTYYIFVTGYYQLNEFVYPEVQILEQLGDYCAKPVAASLPGPGTTSASMLVNCHTIGTDYGEFGPQLTCPVGANTNEYKSSWFRLDISGSDVLDVTAYLDENTNASSSDIKYRLMTGNCGAMQEQSCVLDALTRNTYQCLVPGQSYYVQVFSPILKNGYPVTGDIRLNLSAVKHIDTCAPLTSCLATANFTTVFDCTTDRTVKFVNFSTYGTDITYQWNFGYNNQTSTNVSPTFLYPASATSQTYTVKLVVTNTGCGKRDSVSRQVTVPGRPLVNFGSDRVQCNGQAVTLTATSFNGATYQWQDGSTNPTFTASAAGNNQYFVTVTYNNCISRDTVNVLINPVIKRATQSFILCAANDSVQLDAYRGNGETYLWNNGRTTSSIYVRNPGTYWVNVKYASCTIRDSFIVGSTGTLRPLGRDTLVCLRSGNYLLNATTNGATGYRWQNGSTAATFSVSAAGLYWVDIRFASCSVRDSIVITNYPAPVVQSTPAVICAGQSYTLPWGGSATAAGTYRDTIRNRVGCDSVYEVVTLTVRAKPALGADKTASICQGNSLSLANQFTTTGLTTAWSTAGSPVSGTTINAAGVYQLIGTNGFGCSDTALLTLTVNPKPSLGRDTSISICPFFSVDLTTIYNTSSLTTAWTLNNTAVANPSAVTTAGNYRLIATTSNGCSDTAIATVVRLAKPALGADKTVRICPGFSTDLTNQFTTTGLTTNWSTSNLPIANPAAVDAAGVYQLIAANTVGCADTVLATVVINPKPSIGNDTTILRCDGIPVNLNGLYPGGVLLRTWTIGGIPVTNTAAVYTAGLYRLIVRNSTGCEDTAQVTITINPKPALGNDTSISICPGFTTDLTALYNTAGLATVWTIANAPVANPAGISRAGAYRLIATNTSGCADTALVVVTIRPKPVLGIDKAVSVCPGFTSNLASFFTTTGLITNWTIGGTPVADSSAVGTAGIYQVIATNTNGCSDTALVTLTVLPKPSIGADTTVHVCPSFSIDLTGLYTTTSLTTAWTYNYTSFATPQRATNGGVYTLIVTNASGCKDTALVTVIVDPKPALGNDQLMSTCPGFPVDLTTLYSTTGLNPVWSFGNAAVANPAAVLAPGVYELLVTNAFGCKDTAKATLSLYAKPALGNDASVNICPGFTTNLTTIYNTAGLAIRWTKGNQPIPDSTAVGDAGIYQIIATNTNGCSDTALVTISISPKPNIGADTTVHICPGFGVDLTALYNTAAFTVAWTYNNSSFAAPQNATNGGVYTLIVTNTAGCKDTALVTLIVDPKPALGNDQLISTCPGFPADLTALFSTTGLNPAWSFNGNTVVNPAAVLAPGVYELMVTNSFGCKDTATAALSLYAKPVLGNDASVNICPGFTTNLTTIYNTAGLRVRWSKANQPIADSSAVGTAGLYQLIATNGNGCSDTALVTVTISPKPAIGRDTSVHICPGFSADLTGLYNTASLTAEWFYGNAIVSSASAVSDAGVYRLVVTNAAGCKDTALVTVIIDPKPSLGADQAINFCPGFSGNLSTVYNTAGLSASWTLGGNLVTNPAAVINAGNYQLIATNSFGCSDTAVVTAGIYPKPDLGTDQTAGFCPGFTVDVARLFNTTALTFVWTLGGNPIADPTQINRAGNYRLIATNSNGCSDTAFVQVTRYAKPALGADKTLTICDGAVVNLTAQFNFTGLNTIWTNLGVPVTNPAAVGLAGNYQVIAFNGDGCADTAFVLLNVNPKPFAGNDTTIRICPGASLNLRSVYNTSNLQSAWSLGGVAVSNPNAVNVDGVYRLIVTNSFGCTDTSLLTLITDVNPLLTITNPATICYPDSVDLTAPAVTAGSAGGITLTYWYNSNATGGIGNPASVPAGLYYIKAVNATGCITIKPVTASILPLIKADAGADIAVCKGNQGILQGSVSNASGSVTYLWTPDTGLGVPTSAVTTVNPDTTRTYVLNVKDNYGCNFSVFDSVTVTVPPPVPAFAGNDTIVSTGLPHQLQATGGVAYHWMPENLVSNPFIANPVTTLYVDSVFFNVMVTDANGCIGYDTVKIKTLDGITYWVPNAFSPNGDGKNDVFKPIPVGVVSTEYFRIFNRLGETVYLSNDIGRGWDGTYKGRPQEPANYVWVLKGKGRNGKIIELSGNVVLVR